MTKEAGMHATPGKQQRPVNPGQDTENNVMHPVLPSKVSR